MNTQPTSKWLPEPLPPHTLSLPRYSDFADETSCLAKLVEVDPNDGLIVLDRTLFIPSSDEQIGDFGVLRVPVGKKTKRIKITEVQKTPDGQILHIVDPNDIERLKQVATSAGHGDSVKMNIHPDHRRLQSIQHSTQHLIRSAVEDVTDGRLLYDSGGNLEERGFTRFTGIFPGNLGLLRLSIQNKIAQMRGTSLPRKISISKDNTRTVQFGNSKPIECEGSHVAFMHEANRVNINNVFPLQKDGCAYTVVLSSTYY